MIFLIIVIIITICILITFKNSNVFLFANPEPGPACPVGFKSQGGKCIPSSTMLKNGLTYLSKNPTKPVPVAYKPLITSGYLVKKSDKWTVDSRKPVRQVQPGPKPAPVKPGPKPAPVKPAPVKPGPKPVPKPGPPVKSGGPSQLPSSPNQQKPTSCTFGGKQNKNCLLQYYNGNQNFQSSNNGTRLQASINPSSLDGSKNDGSQNRIRNEIAVRDVMKKDGQTISFNFSASGGNNVNKNKSAIFFQIKPQGTGNNDSLIRLGIKNGMVSYGLHGNDTVPTNIPANQHNNIQIKANNGQGTVYINGQPVKDSKGQNVSFSLGAAANSQIKFGLEAVPGQIDGTITGSYDNISF
jgi:outer membrane biosynthesis protein TonB